MNRTDQDLKEAIAANERRALWGAGAVIFGLILEVIFAAGFREPPETIVSHWGPVVADALVALGVAGEVLFGRESRIDSEELTRRSEERLGEAHARAEEANARAAEAELALAKFRKPRQLSVKGNEAFITELLKPFAGTRFDSAINGSGEVADFWWDLQPAIVAAGWIHLDWGILPMTQVIKQGDRPLSGTAGASNVEIHIRPEERIGFAPAAAALISALTEIGIAATDKGFNSHSTNPQAIHIHIGDKL